MWSETQMRFSHALDMITAGQKLARSGWNGKDMYVKLVKSHDFEFSELNSHFVIKNVKNSFDTWVPSVSDLLAEDWVLVS
jgi:hypothetical protein